MHLSDPELIVRIRQHDTLAFEVVFRRYYRYLYAVALRYLKDPDLTEDAVQEVFLKLWQHRHRLNEQQSIRNFLSVATRHQVLNMIRDEKRTILHHIAYGQHRPLTDTATEDTLALSDYTSVLSEAVARLSNQRRHIFELKSQAGLTNEEVARQLNISVNTVKVQYYHATQFLRGYLRQHSGIESLLVTLIGLSLEIFSPFT